MPFDGDFFRLFPATFSGHCPPFPLMATDSNGRQSTAMDSNGQQWTAMDGNQQW